MASRVARTAPEPHSPLSGRHGVSAKESESPHPCRRDGQTAPQAPLAPVPLALDPAGLGSPGVNSLQRPPPAAAQRPHVPAHWRGPVAALCGRLGAQIAAGGAGSHSAFIFSLNCLLVYPERQTPRVAFHTLSRPWDAPCDAPCDALCGQRGQAAGGGRLWSHSVRRLQPMHMTLLVR